jgi:hypothetical protein
MSASLSRKAGSEEQVGDVKQSVLTEAQFQSLHGTSWVLMDGRSVAGSDLDTEFGVSTLPDARGVFLRSKNNGRSDGNQNPAGERAVGFLESDQMQGHKHGMDKAGMGYGAGPGDGSWGRADTNSPANAWVYNVGNPSTDTINGTPRTGAETRPKNITVNTFIKINR